MGHAADRRMLAGMKVRHHIWKTPTIAMIAAALLAGCQNSKATKKESPDSGDFLEAAQVITPDPIIEPITKSGLAVELIDFVQIPPSSNERPLALINFLFHAGDATGRLFVVDSRGKIHVVKNGRLLAEPFLDIATVRGAAFRVKGGQDGIRAFVCR